MKLKNYFSEWNTTDKIISIISIIGIVVILSLMCCSCHAQDLSNLTPIEYNDASGENFDVIINEIPMYADGIIDFNYTPIDNFYSIEYNDSDSFDYDNLQNNGEEWYGDYIIIECNKELFFEYLEWYHTVSDDKSDAYYDINDNFYIKEIVTPVDGGFNYRYYLAKY